MGTASQPPRSDCAAESAFRSSHTDPSMSTPASDCSRRSSRAWRPAFRLIRVHGRQNARAVTPKLPAPYRWSVPSPCSASKYQPVKFCCSDSAR